MTAFRSKEFLPPDLIHRITEIRVNDPERPMRIAGKRELRRELTQDGRLNLLAADHPARRVLSVGTDQLGMADRHDYLARIVRVLQQSDIDGVMATMDILEDLLVLSELLDAGVKPGLLDGKLLIASLNRGGLQNVSWEMDDPLTGATPATLADWRLDGAKLLLRICDDEPDSLKTILAAGRAITEMNRLRLPMFLEPLPAVRTERGFKVVKTTEALARIVSVATALGDSSRYLWLKLPYCEDFDVVAEATTLPILLLGGESTGDPVQFMHQVQSAMAASHNVRGVLVGRNVLYAGDADPAAIARAIGRIVHQGANVEEALEV